MECRVYRSSRREGVYLYVAKDELLEQLPEDLKTLLGKPIFMLSFDLYPERRLARVEAKAVLAAIEDKGYFLRLDTVAEENNLLNRDRTSRGLPTVKNEKLC